MSNGNLPFVRSSEQTKITDPASGDDLSVIEILDEQGVSCIEIPSQNPFRDGQSILFVIEYVMDIAFAAGGAERPPIGKGVDASPAVRPGGSRPASIGQQR